MKILVVSQYFYPENFRINDIVEELVKRGHAVTVLTGRPNYPEGKIYEGYQDSHKTVSNYHGAVVYRCKLRPRKSGALNLALNYLSFVKQAKKALKRIKPDFDVIYFYEPSPISSGLPAVWYGEKHHIKTVIYNLDIWPECVRDSRGGKVMSKNNPIFLIAKKISKNVYSRFDLIINKCDEFADYLEEELNISRNKMTTLYEHAENTYLTVNEKPIDNGVVDFMFLGNIGKAQNCDQMVMAFSRLQNKEHAVLHFVGDGSYLLKLKELVSNINLTDKVCFHGRKTIEETIDYYNLADVCLLALSNQTASGLTPPAKLQGYMAASRTIIASINGSAKTIIKNAKCGFVCDADSIEQLTFLMEHAIEDITSLAEIGRKGREFFLQHFTIERHIDRLEHLFGRL